MPRPRSILDLSRVIGPIVSTQKVVYPIASYDRPAYNFWNGVAQALEERGYTNEEIILILQSKAVRHLLDRMDHEILQLGRKSAKTRLMRDELQAVLDEKK